MKVSVSQSEIAASGADLVAVGLCEGEELPGELASAPGAADAKGGFKKLSTIHPEQPARVVVAGLGKREDLDAERLRVAAALVAKEAGRLEATSLAWVLPEGGEDGALAEGLVTGTILGAYRFDRFKSKPTPTIRSRRTLDSLTLLGARERRLGGRVRPRLRRGAEPRPRPAEPALQRRHPFLPRRAAPRRSPPPTTRSASRCSAARRSPPRSMGGLVAVSQGGAGGAEADRAALRRRRRRARPSAWSARASPSTPAASR